MNQSEKQAPFSIQETCPARFHLLDAECTQACRTLLSLVHCIALCCPLTLTVRSCLGLLNIYTKYASFITARQTYSDKVIHLYFLKNQESSMQDGEDKSSTSNQDVHTVYTLLMEATWEHIHFHLTNLCLSEPEMCCLADLHHPPPAFGSAHKLPSSLLKSPVLWTHPFSRRWASQDSAKQSRAEGSLAVLVLVQNQTQISNTETLSQAPSDALRSTEWNIDGSWRCKLCRVCMGKQCLHVCVTLFLWLCECGYPKIKTWTNVRWFLSVPKSKSRTTATTQVLHNALTPTL